MKKQIKQKINNIKTKDILKQLDWEDIFSNTSQTENLYDFLKNNINLNEFTKGFYSKCKNKKLIKNNLKSSQISYFKKHAKKIWNLANVQQFSNGDEYQKIEKYINKL